MTGIKKSNLICIASSFAFVATSMLGGVAKAQDAALLQCIQRYTAIKISADAALAECQKSNVVDCVKRLMAGKDVATAIRKTSEGNLIDLGNTESRWLEGKQWKEKNCSAYSQGPYKRQSDKQKTFWGEQRSYEWFRQGWCAAESIELEQPYSIEEAKIRCDLGVSLPPETKDAVSPVITR